MWLKMIIQLNEEDLKFINSTLLNDENSTDEQLIKLFQEELKISLEASKRIVSFRNDALINFLDFDIKERLENDNQ